MKFRRRNFITAVALLFFTDGKIAVTRAGTAGRSVQVGAVGQGTTNSESNSIGTRPNAVQLCPLDYGPPEVRIIETTATASEINDGLDDDAKRRKLVNFENKKQHHHQQKSLHNRLLLHQRPPPIEIIRQAGEFVEFRVRTDSPYFMEAAVPATIRKFSGVGTEGIGDGPSQKQTQRIYTVYEGDEFMSKRCHITDSLSAVSRSDDETSNSGSNSSNDEIEGVLKAHCSAIGKSAPVSLLYYMQEMLGEGDGGDENYSSSSTKYTTKLPPPPPPPPPCICPLSHNDSSFFPTATNINTSRLVVVEFRFNLICMPTCSITKEANPPDQDQHQQLSGKENRAIAVSSLGDNFMGAVAEQVIISGVMIKGTPGGLSNKGGSSFNKKLTLIKGGSLTPSTPSKPGGILQLLEMSASGPNQINRNNKLITDTLWRKKTHTSSAAAASMPLILALVAPSLQILKTSMNSHLLQISALLDR